MTEGQDVTAPAAPRAVSAPAEAAAGWAFGRGLPGSPGSDSAPAGSGPAGAAVTVTAPASDAGWMSAPPGDLAATAALHHAIHRGIG